MTQRLPFAGRADHLGSLEDAVRTAVEGRRALVSIEGAAGTGKSRLLDEAELRHATADVELRRATVYPSWSTRPGALAEALGLDDTDGSRALVLLIDDADRSDPTSLTVLRDVLLRVDGTGVAVVLTHRAVTERDAPGLHRLFETADRRGELRRLTLGPLRASELREIVGGPEASDVADRLIAESGGVPLRLQEVVDDLLEQDHLRHDDGLLAAERPVAGWPVSRSVGQRLSELSADAQRLVHAVALAGGPLPLAVAANLLETGEDEALDLGEQLVDDGFLAEDPAGFRPRTHTEAERLAAELGTLRTTRTYRELAAAATAAGLDATRPDLVGTYLQRAGEWDRAAPLLAEAGLEAADRDAYAEALPLVSGALEAVERIRSPDPQLVGELRFARARCHRMLGRSDLAADDADEASRLLSGESMMRLLGWRAQIADDEQAATRGEWLTALAELEAARQGDGATHGAHLTLRAKMFGRLGLPAEADACLKRGIRLLRLHEGDRARFMGHWNGAWLAFDRGQVREAASGFEHCSERARSFDSEEWLAQSEAWRARALFWTGHVEEAWETHARAMESAERTDSVGPRFLGALARAEGALLLGEYGEARFAADDALEIVLRQIPVWENVVRYLRAAALLGEGELDVAHREAQLALDACPDGPDGERWRTSCRALLLETAAATGEPWRGDEATDLTRQLLSSRWFAPAVRLLIARAAHEDEPDLARRAAALADELGAPLLAARALGTAELWGDPIAPVITTSLHEAAGRIPEPWHSAWRVRDDVAPGLAGEPVGAGDRIESAAALRRHLEDLLGTVGLIPDDLSIGPSEWSAPLPRVRSDQGSDRGRGIGALLAVGAVVLVLGGAAIGGLLRTGPDEVDRPAAADDVAFDIIAPAEMIIGSWIDRGGPERTGVATREDSGIGEFDGLYWEPFCAGEPIMSTPAVHGQFAYFGAGENVYAINLTSGEQLWRQPTDGEVRAAVTVAGRVGEGGLADADPMVIASSRDGTVHAWTTGGERRWSSTVASRIESSPLFFEGVVYVGSHDGYLHALEAASGEELWRFPEDEPIGTIRSSAAVVDGLVLIGSDDGSVYAVRHEDGSQAWSSSTGAPVVATPAIHDGIVYAASLGESVWAFDVDSGRPMGVGTYRTDRQMGASPAVDAGHLYVPSNIRLLALDLVTGDVAWSLTTGAAVASSPVIAGDLLYVGSDDGILYAIDVRDGQIDREPRWTFETGNAIAASAAVADGVVLIGSTDGCLYALGQEGAVEGVGEDGPIEEDPADVTPPEEEDLEDAPADTM